MVTTREVEEEEDEKDAEGREKEDGEGDGGLASLKNGSRPLIGAHSTAGPFAIQQQSSWKKNEQAWNTHTPAAQP